MIPDDDPGWWMHVNRYGGAHHAKGKTQGEARDWTRGLIAESFRNEGLTVKQSQQAGRSYGIRTIAGPGTYGQIREACRLWEDAGTVATLGYLAAAGIPVLVSVRQLEPLRDADLSDPGGMITP